MFSLIHVMSMRPGLQVNLYCYRCTDEWESLEHALWKCIALNELWDASPLRDHRPMCMNLNIFDVFQYFMELNGGSWLRIFGFFVG